jgi:recombination protein RecT
MSQTTAVAQRAKEQRMTLRNLFEQQRPELAKLLPRGMDPDRLFRMALTEVIKNPTLLECSAESWALAVQTCAQQGLYPDSGLGYMYLVPRKKAGVQEVSAMRGYQGDIKLARNSGEITDIYAEVVHKKDLYKVTKGLHRNIVHEPYDGEDDDPGPLVACYAVAKLTSGEVPFVTLRKRDVERHRASSESWQKDWSPWQKHTEAMWKKTAIHELAKWLPKDSEAAEKAVRAIMGEAAAIDTTAIEASSVPVAPRSGLEGLTADLQASAAAGTEPPAAAEPETREPADCKHPAVPPSRVEALAPGKALVCPDCGQELRKTREPGEDDEPLTEPEAKQAVAAIAAAATTQAPRKGGPAQSRLQE